MYLFYVLIMNMCYFGPSQYCCPVVGSRCTHKPVRRAVGGTCDWERTYLRVCVRVYAFVDVTVAFYK